MARVTARKVVNALFATSSRLNTRDGYDYLSAEDRETLKGYINRARSGKPRNVSVKERIEYFVSNIPEDVVKDIDKRTATRLSKVRTNRHLLRKNFLKTVPDPGFGRKATQGEIAGQKAVREMEAEIKRKQDAEEHALGRATEAIMRGEEIQTSRKRTRLPEPAAAPAAAPPEKRLKGNQEASITASDVIVVADAGAPDPLEAPDDALARARGLEAERVAGTLVEAEEAKAVHDKAVEEQRAKPSDFAPQRRPKRQEPSGLAPTDVLRGRKRRDKTDVPEVRQEDVEEVEDSETEDPDQPQRGDLAFVEEWKASKKKRERWARKRREREVQQAIEEELDAGLTPSRESRATPAPPKLTETRISTGFPAPPPAPPTTSAPPPGVATMPELKPFTVPAPGVGPTSTALPPGVGPTATPPTQRQPPNKEPQMQLPAESPSFMTDIDDAEVISYPPPKLMQPWRGDNVFKPFAGGMFGQRSEGSLFPNAPPGVGFGGALSRFGGSSLLDRMSPGGGSEVNFALGIIEKLAKSQGESQNQLLGVIEKLAPRVVSDAISIARDPTQFPRIAMRELDERGIFDRLTNRFKEAILGGGSRPLHAIPPINVNPVINVTGNKQEITQAPPLRVRGWDGLVNPPSSQDTVSRQEQEPRAMLNPTFDQEDRPQNAFRQAAGNLVQAGLDKARSSIGTAVGNKVEEAALAVGRAGLEALPIPDTIRGVLDSGVQHVAKKVGAAVTSRIADPSDRKQADRAKQLQIDVLDELEEEKEPRYTVARSTSEPYQQPPTETPTFTVARPPGPVKRTADFQPPSQPFQARPLIAPETRAPPPRTARSSSSRPPQVNRLRPYNPGQQPAFTIGQPQFKSRGKSSRARRPPRRPTWTPPAQETEQKHPPREEEEEEPEVPETEGRYPQPPQGTDPGADARQRFQQQNTQGIDELPLRPEVRRAGLDTLQWPTQGQISDKLEEATYYVPKHEGRGTMYDNPLIRQNVLQDALRFRKTDPMPRKRRAVSAPDPQKRRKVSMLLQNSYNTTNGMLKMNPITATPVPLSQRMMSSKYESTPMMDAYIPASVQAGGAPFTRAGMVYSLS